MRRQRGDSIRMMKENQKMHYNLKYNDRVVGELVADNASEMLVQIWIRQNKSVKRNLSV